MIFAIYHKSHRDNVKAYTYIYNHLRRFLIPIETADREIGLIKIQGCNIRLIFRTGSIDNCAGLRPKYFMADTDEGVNFLRQSADKVDGTRLYDLSAVIELIVELYWEGNRKKYQEDVEMKGLDINNARNIKLLSKTCYEQYGHLYLELVYEYENESGKYKLIIPKIDLEICTERLPKFSQESGFINPRYIADLGGIHYDLCSTDVRCRDKDGKLRYVPDSSYVTVLLEEKKHEMTLEEIEKKLGYKVKIVSEKED